PSLYELARVGAGMAQEHAADIRDAAAVRAALASARPEIVLHLAAQPFVRRSLAEPASTFEVNVLGTVNVLDAVRESGRDVRAVDTGEAVRVRNPDAVRPWQHLLNPLSGYLLLAQECARSATAARAWNFGPRAHDEQPVRVVLDRLRELWRGEFRWELDGGD